MADTKIKDLSSKTPVVLDELVINDVTDDSDGKVTVGAMLDIINGTVNVDSAGASTMAANSIDSDQYVDGSIDNAHLANLAVDTAEMADNSVTLAKMAHGTDGNLITYSATGAPAFVATGNSGQVLTSGGVGVAPTFQAAATGGHTIEEEGTPLTARTKLNFIGAAITATDDSGDDASDITVSCEANSTADQTGAEIKTAYEAESNAYTDTKNTKLAGIETSADVTDITNVNAAAATIVGTVATGTWQATAIASLYLDADTMHLAVAQTVTGKKTFGAAGAVGDLAIAGTTSGSTVLDATASASGVLTLPAATDTLVARDTTDIVATQLTGIIADARMPDLTGDITTSEGAVATTIGANKVLLSMVANAAKTETLIIPASDNTTALATGIVFTFYMPYAMTITDIRASVLTAPTDATLIVDVHEAGVTLMGTDKLDIETTEFHTKDAGTQPVVSAGAVANNAKMEIEIDQIGSSVAGAGLVVYLIGYQT